MNGTYSHSSTAARPLMSRQRFGLPQRLLLLAVLLAAEVIAITTWMDFRALRGNGKFGLQAAVAFPAFFLLFGYHRSKVAFQRISNQFVLRPVKWDFLAAHFSAMAACVALFAALFAGTPAGLQGTLLEARWALGGLGICFAGLAFVPLRIWLSLVYSGGAAWAYASAALLAMWKITRWSESLWQPATKLTFGLVKVLLHPMVPDLTADPATFTITSHKFALTVLTPCSGIEGLGMIVVFSVSWLWLFRRECRFPQALLLIPAGISTLWLLNVVRIGALFLIGNGGATRVTVAGFHSEAGWITFTAVAVAFSLAAQRVRWFRIAGPGPRPGIEERSAENPTAAYLMPLSAIFAAAMIAHAVTGGFEWLYPLRVLATAGAVWFFWPQYAKLNWGFGWVAPVVGVLVFTLWIGLNAYLGHKDNGIQAGLAALPVFGRVTWLAFRTLGAVIAVPIAEELAFRGFLIRRIMRGDFESLDSRTFTYSAVLLSSVAFGLLHGDRWLAGIVAGILYAAAFLWRGRIGDAVVAHAVTNALIAASVLFGGSWYLW
jgi:exosortase E/protease (VPEID-CTERM system)